MRIKTTLIMYKYKHFTSNFLNIFQNVCLTTKVLSIFGIILIALTVQTTTTNGHAIRIEREIIQSASATSNSDNNFNISSFTAALPTKVKTANESSFETDTEVKNKKIVIENDDRSNSVNNVETNVKSDRKNNHEVDAEVSAPAVQDVSIARNATEVVKTTTDVNNVIPQDYDGREHQIAKATVSVSPPNNASDVTTAKTVKKQFVSNDAEPNGADSDDIETSFTKNISQENGLVENRLPLKPSDKKSSSIPTTKSSQLTTLAKITTESDDVAAKESPQTTARPLPPNSMEKLKRTDSTFQKSSTEPVTTVTTTALLQPQMNHTISVHSRSESTQKNPSIESIRFEENILKVKPTLPIPEIVTEKRAKYLDNSNVNLSQTAPIESEAAAAVEAWASLKTIGEVNHNNVTLGAKAANIDDAEKSISDKLNSDEIEHNSAVISSTEKNSEEHETQLQKQKFNLSTNSSRIDDNVHEDNSLISFQSATNRPISAAITTTSKLLPLHTTNQQNDSIYKIVPITQNYSQVESPTNATTIPLVDTSERIRAPDDSTEKEVLISTTMDEQLTTTEEIDQTTLFEGVTTSGTTLKPFKAVTNEKMSNASDNGNDTHSPIILKRPPINTTIRMTTSLPDESVPNTTYFTTSEVAEQQQRETTQSQYVEGIEGTTVFTQIIPSTTSVAEKTDATNHSSTNEPITKSQAVTDQASVDRNSTEKMVKIFNRTEMPIENDEITQRNLKPIQTAAVVDSTTKQHETQTAKEPNTNDTHENPKQSATEIIRTDVLTAIDIAVDKSPSSEPPPTENPTQDEIHPNAKKGPDVNAIIAVSVSVVAVVTLILLVGFLFVMRKRQKQLTYGQRCRPVGLDAYSLDNISVYNSVRRKSAMRTSKRAYGNAAFDDPALKNNLLTISQLAVFVEKKSAINEEFRDVPLVTARIDEVPAGCEDKNRYANIVPLPESRVHLKQLNDDEKTEYINANYVKGPKDTTHYYIACQAPLENTIVDFWRMIWEQNSRVIIMATDLTENGIEKCAEYLPPSFVIDNHVTFGDYQITLKNREVHDKYAVSMVHVMNMCTKTWREITHLWYQWPESGVPADEASIIAMLLEARSYLKMVTPEQSATDNSDTTTKTTTTTTTSEQESDLDIKMSNGNGAADKSKSLQRIQGPLTVHCSPGTGRTGTIIACDIAIRALEQPTRSVDIPQIVYVVRRGRASAVQTRDQYEFIYKVAHMYATKLTGPINEN